MDYLDQALMTGEHILWRGKEHWIPVFSGPIAFLLVGILVGVGIADDWAAALGILLALCSLPAALWVLVRWRAQDFALTDRRAISKTGVICI